MMIASINSMKLNEMTCTKLQLHKSDKMWFCPNHFRVKIGCPNYWDMKIFYRAQILSIVGGGAENP